MHYDVDVVVIGTGTSAFMTVYACLAANLTVAVVDRREYGGTCAMRGCQPKKYLVAAAEAVAQCKRMQGIGLRGMPLLEWPELIRSKNCFTDAVPQRTEKGFQQKGAATLHGVARFTGPNTISVNGEELVAKYIVIASGAVPKPLGFPGEQHLITSEDFMNLEKMAKKVLFVGGGYISLEFAVVAALAGAEVTILQHSERILRRFDPDCVEVLEKSCKDLGIRLLKNVPVERIDRDASGFSVQCKAGGDLRYHHADLVVHGAGLIPDLEDLDLEKGNVDATGKGIEVNSYLQSVSNPAVYAIGDVAATPYRLATTADLEGELAAQNIIHGNRSMPNEEVVPSVVFTSPPLAAVGILEESARKEGIAIKVNKGEMNRWPSSMRIGQKHCFYKIILGRDDGRILGAHLLGHNADEVINIFALAIDLKLTGEQLKNTLWAYPTYTSDLKYMVG